MTDETETSGERDDARVRAMFEALREHDREATPSFAAMRGAASQAAAVSTARRHGRRWGVIAGVALGSGTLTLAAAAAVLLTVTLGETGQRSPAGVLPVVAWDDTEPLAFLLDSPGASVVTSKVELDRTPWGERGSKEAW